MLAGRFGQDIVTQRKMLTTILICSMTRVRVCQQGSIPYMVKSNHVRPGVCTGYGDSWHGQIWPCLMNARPAERELFPQGPRTFTTQLGMAAAVLHSYIKSRRTHSSSPCSSSFKASLEPTVLAWNFSRDKELSLLPCHLRDKCTSFLSPLSLFTSYFRLFSVFFFASAHWRLPWSEVEPVKDPVSRLFRPLLMLLLKRWSNVCPLWDPKIFCCAVCYPKPRANCKLRSRFVNECMRCAMCTRPSNSNIGIHIFILYTFINIFVHANIFIYVDMNAHIFLHI